MQERVPLIKAPIGRLFTKVHICQQAPFIQAHIQAHIRAHIQAHIQAHIRSTLTTFSLQVVSPVCL